MCKSVAEMRTEEELYVLGLLCGRCRVMAEEKDVDLLAAFPEELAGCNACLNRLKEEVKP
jgi:hypothetical protein